MKCNISRRAFLRQCACLAAAAGLTACGAGDAPSEDLPKVVVGSITYPPYVYLDNDGTPTGIDIDIAEEAFHRMGCQPEFVTIDWDNKDALLADGTVDCAWCCFSMSGREGDYTWAGPYMISTQVVAVGEESDIYTLSDLEGRTIMLRSGSKPEEVFLSGTDARLPQLADIISIEDRSAQYAMLDCGYVDAVAAHEAAIYQYIKDYGAALRVLDEPLLTTGLGVAFAAGDPRGLARKLDEVFVQMREDGTMEAIIGRYLDNAPSYLEVDGLEQ